MMNELKTAKDKGYPADIYYNVELDGETKSYLIYQAFLVTEIDEKNQTFSGFEIRERNKQSKDRILTTDTYLSISEVYIPEELQ